MEIESLIAPGPDGLLGTADDTSRPLNEFTREVVIRDVSLTLRQLTVIIRYRIGNMSREYTDLHADLELRVTMRTTTIASARASERGFSLPELLVASAITLIGPRRSVQRPSRNRAGHQAGGDDHRCESERAGRDERADSRSAAGG